MAEYNPDLVQSYATSNKKFGGITASADEVPNDIVNSTDLAEVEKELLRDGNLKIGTLVLVQKRFQDGEEVIDLYTVAETGRSYSNRTYRQFRVFQEVTGDHKVVYQNNGDRYYKIPTDTQYPCTHIDVPDDELIEIDHPYTYVPETEWLTQLLDLEAEVLSHHI